MTVTKLREYSTIRKSYTSSHYKNASGLVVAVKTTGKEDWPHKTTLVTEKDSSIENKSSLVEW